MKIVVPRDVTYGQRPLPRGACDRDATSHNAHECVGIHVWPESDCCGSVLCDSVMHGIPNIDAGVCRVC